MNAETKMLAKAVPLQRPVISGRDREFLPAALEILETPPPVAATALVLVLCALVAAALLWSFVGRLDVMAVAPGKIETEGHAKVIEPLEPGRVAAIQVENGAQVAAGQLLVAFEDAEAGADVKTYSDENLSSRAEIMRRARAVEVAREFGDQASPSAKSLTMPELTVPWEPAIPDHLRQREAAVLHADVRQLVDNLNDLAKQIAQKEATKTKLNMSIVEQEDLMKVLNGRVDMRQQSLQKEIGTKVNLFDAQEALKKSQSSLASDRGALIEAEAAIDELNSQRTKTLSQFVADNQSKLTEAARKADDTLQQLNKAEVKLRRTRLVSPIDGTVQQLSVTTVGQVVTTGQQLMLITPSHAPLLVQALLNNDDIGFVKVGQEVAVKVDAFPFTRFGTLHGKVLKIATDAVDEQDAKRSQASATALANGTGAATSTAQGQPQSFVFPVTISLQEKSMPVGNVSVPLSPGMTVTAEIKTDSRRVIDYLLSPIAKITSEAMKER